VSLGVRVGEPGWRGGGVPLEVPGEVCLVINADPEGDVGGPGAVQQQARLQAARARSSDSAAIWHASAHDGPAEAFALGWVWRYAYFEDPAGIFVSVELRF
jgi:hypothetical protein